MERDEIHELLDELARILIATESLDSTLLTVSHMTTRALEGCDAAGVTLLESDRSVKSTACTDPLVEAVDRAQYETGEGPCVQALDEDRAIRTGHADADDRWPHFGELAVQHGVKSVLAFPLEVGGESIGALNCYGRLEDAFGDPDERVGTLLASQAAVVLANAAAYDDAHSRSVNLERALESRGIIERAKGILMAREQCTSDEAFEMLVEASQQVNLKLRDIAQDLVERQEVESKKFPGFLPPSLR